MVFPFGPSRRGGFYFVHEMRTARRVCAGTACRIALAAGLMFGVAVCAASPPKPHSGPGRATNSDGPAATPPASTMRGMSQADFEKLDCKTRWRVYRQSQDCFAPYIQQPPYVAPPAAYEECGVNFKDPSPQCGIEAR